VTTEDPKPSWRRLTGLGLELFGMVFGFVLLGTWIDRRYDTSPWGVLICAVLGIAGGLYNLIRSALQTLKTSDPPRPAGGGGAAENEPASRPVKSEGDGQADGR
jgi:F0F1-type ATP synthase assembly protein I